MYTYAMKSLSCKVKLKQDTFRAMDRSVVHKQQEVLCCVHTYKCNQIQ